MLEKMERIMDDVRKLMDAPKPEVVATPERDIITANEFAARIGAGENLLNKLINGTHSNGFKLKTFKKEGTRTVWTLTSEYDRWFEGFGKKSA
jgi:hypothetical protein